MKLLQDRVAIITGASAVAGKGIALNFARQGASIIVAEINEKSGEAAVDQLTRLGTKAKFIPTDIGDSASVKSMVEQTIDTFSRIDILVNNAYPAMINPPVVDETIGEDCLHASMLAGFHAVATAMHAVFPHMQAAQWGRIINVCSLNGVNAHQFTADYHAAKDAVHAATRTAAIEWGQYNITANIICPAAATTPIKAMEQVAPEMISGAIDANPKGRKGGPGKTVGGVALCLASDYSQYVTGNTLFVDGGAHLNGVPWGAENADFS